MKGNSNNRNNHSEKIKQVINELQSLISNGKSTLIGLSDQEFIEHFVGNERLISILSIHWKTFALQFNKNLQIDDITYTSEAPTQKLLSVFTKLRNHNDDINISEFIDALIKAVEIANLNNTSDKSNDREEKHLEIISSTKLEIGELIGSGGYAEVFQGKWQGIEVAIKKLNVKKLPHNLEQDFKNEAYILANCRHPSIVGLFGICLEPNCYSIVLEYLPKGSLYSILHDSRIEISWNPTCNNIILDIVRGLNYLHCKDKPIIHGDLKSMNILLDNNFRAKITDFGLAKIKTATSTVSTINKKMGSIRWNAPELFKNASKSEETDIYSFGMVVWEIVSKKLPFSEIEEDMMVAIKIMGGNNHQSIPEVCPNFISELILKCWNNNPKDRPSTGTILDILRKHIDETDLEKNDNNNKGETTSIPVEKEQKIDITTTTTSSSNNKELPSEISQGPKNKSNVIKWGENFSCPGCDMSWSFYVAKGPLNLIKARHYYNGNRFIYEGLGSALQVRAVGNGGNDHCGYKSDKKCPACKTPLKWV